MKLLKKDNCQRIEKLRKKINHRQNIIPEEYLSSLFNFLKENYLY